MFDEKILMIIYVFYCRVNRKANHLARGALIAAADQQSAQINAEHVRLAATEIF